MSMFSGLAALARGAVERVHGDLVQIRPMDRATGPNAPRGPSVERMPWTATALFYREADSVERDMAAAFPRSVFNQGGAMRAGRHIASIATGQAGQVPIAGDILIRDHDQERFEITAADPDGLGNFTCVLASGAKQK